MTPLDQLLARLQGLEGKGYKAYKEVAGGYRAPGLEFRIDHVQGDPFADPSRVRAVLAPDEAGLPHWARATSDRRRAVADYLNRRLARALAAASRPLGSGASGQLRILTPGQQVLARASLEVAADGTVVARFRIGLPARGRRILGAAAAELVAAAAAAAGETLPFGTLEEEALRRHVAVVEDAVALRRQLPGLGLVAFVADGALLPRRTGIDDRPLAREEAVPFTSPGSLRVGLAAPNGGRIEGMGIPEGITLIVGGGYHGKSTLLRAVERGVYDHVPGDGRERVVTVPRAAKVRAEDGRSVAGTDISNFIGTLPSGGDTVRFLTRNASGSTSQAAAIVEALEVGATALLLDEDTSATNFMIRDARMQRLVASADEPITPFIDRARTLYDGEGVSTVLVVGGSGDYFDVADTVISMKEYRPADVTAEARRVAADMPSARESAGRAWSPIRARYPDPASLSPRRGHRPLAIRILSRDRVQYGDDQVDLAAVEPLVEKAQTRAMAFAIARARETAMDGGRRTLREVMEAVLAEIAEAGLTVLHPHGVGELAEFRPLELAAFLNRMRTLRTKQEGET